MLYIFFPLLVYIGFSLCSAFWLLASNSFITDPADIALAAKDTKLKKQTHLAYAVSLLSVVASGILAGKGAQAWESAFALLLALVVLALLLRARRARLPFPVWCASLGGGALALACSWGLPIAMGSLLFVALGLGTERRKLTLLGAAGFAACLAHKLLLNF